MNPEAPLHPFLSAAGLAMALAFLAAPARAEDPLLGNIRVIKCVGCDPGAVNLVIHDPIDVRDFEVQIKESDYQKVITPLAGKTVYDKEGCFYWMDLPKAAPLPAGKEPGKDQATREGDAKAGKKSMKRGAAEADSSKPGATAGMLETAAAGQPEGRPSRCIPYVRIEPKPAHPGGKKED